MKLPSNTYSAVATEGIPEYRFGIRTADMGIILDILRSKMYSNPIAAICREIASNSRDANREAGRKDTPVIISVDLSLFNPGEVTVSFTDNGLGISEERISEIFINYGASTKRDSNVQVGGFGLGCKTPFSYVDSFTVITVVDKIKYTYIAAIDECNTGKMFMVSKESTTESNGTSVIIPIKGNDVNEFEKEIVKSTYFWDVRPVYKGFSIEIPKLIVLKIGNGFVASGANYNDFFSGSYALVDGIPYPLPSDCQEQYHRNIAGIFLLFKTGEITLAATRETLQFEEKTSKLIKAKYRKFLDATLEYIQEKIDGCKNKLEVILFYKEASNHINEFLIDLLEFRSNKHLQYQGIPIKELYNFKYIRLARIQNGDHRSGWLSRGCNPSGELLKFPVYSMDIERRTPGRDKTIFSTHQMFYIFEITYKEFYRFSRMAFKEKKAIAPKVRKIIDEYNELKKFGIPFSNYSEIVPTKITRKKGEKDLNKRLCARIINPAGKFSYRYMDSASLKKEDFCYAVFHRDQYSKYTDWAYFLKRIGKTVLFVYKSNEKYLRDKILPIDKFISILDRKQMVSYSDKSHIAGFLYSMDLDLSDIVKYTFSFITPNDIDCIKEFSRNAMDLPKDFQQLFPVSQKAVRLGDKLKYIQKTYPLLKCLSIGDKDLPHVNHYIKLIEKEAPPCPSLVG